MVKNISCRNVHDALALGMDGFRWDTQVSEQDSRAGTTLEYNSPVVTTYQQPLERVMFWSQRDANPFFHFMEGLWMLQGRNDVAFVRKFNANMQSFSDNGLTFNGAYGERWRSFWDKDQLIEIIKILSENPNDRRCVLAMWDVVNDLGRKTLDTPCNTHIYFKIRDNKLNMTVCCRSNDMIWGAYGANAVHFSMLQEYMATMIGVEVGLYRQISDSFHVYKDLFEKLSESFPEQDFYSKKYPMVKNPYENLEVYPMVTNTEYFDKDLDTFFMSVEANRFTYPYVNTFFPDVVVPMYQSWQMHKDGNTMGAIGFLDEHCKALDWAKACTEWLKRRQENKVEVKDTEAVIGSEEKDIGPCHK